MKSKSNEYLPSTDGKDFFDSGPRHGLSKFEHDLYKENDDVVMRMVRIKRVPLPNKGENWKIFEGTKLAQLIEGSKLTMKERQFLHTIDGINFVLAYYKSGWKNTASFKKEIRLKVK